MWHLYARLHCRYRLRGSLQPQTFHAQPAGWTPSVLDEGGAEKLLWKGRVGEYRIYRGLFQTRGIALDDWKQQQADAGVERGDAGVVQIRVRAVG